MAGVNSYVDLTAGPEGAPERRGMGTHSTHRVSQTAIVKNQTLLSSSHSATLPPPESYKSPMAQVTTFHHSPCVLSAVSLSVRGQQRLLCSWTRTFYISDTGAVVKPRNVRACGDADVIYVSSDSDD